MRKDVIIGQSGIHTIVRTYSTLRSLVKMTVLQRYPYTRSAWIKVLRYISTEMMVQEYHWRATIQDIYRKRRDRYCGHGIFFKTSGVIDSSKKCKIAFLAHNLVLAWMKEGTPGPLFS